MSWILCNKCKHIINRTPCEHCGNDLSTQIYTSDNTSDDYKKLLQPQDKERA